MAEINADRQALIAAGWAALVKGDCDGALAKFQAALSADSGSVEAQYGVAACFKALGRPGEAIHAFEQAIAKISAADNAADRVRGAMLKHMAESALRDLKTGGKPGASEPPR